MTEPLPPRSAIVEACRLEGSTNPEVAADCAIKSPSAWPTIINIASRLTELRPDLYPADPDPITLAVREIEALAYEARGFSGAAQSHRDGDFDNLPYSLAIRAVIEKLIEEMKS